MSTNCDIDRVKETASNLLIALKKIASYSKDNDVQDVYNRMGWRMQEIADEAIKKGLK